MADADALRQIRMNEMRAMAVRRTNRLHGHRARIYNPAL